MDSTKNVHQRLAAVMATVTYIQKEAKQGMNYTIVSHDAVTSKVRPALLENGVIYYPVRCAHTHNGNRAECSMTVRFANIDAPADFIDVESFGYGVDPQDKGPGKAMSYAVKYALLKALGLETGDDADHDDRPYSPVDPAIPAFDAAGCLSRLLTAIPRRKTKQELQQLWADEADARIALKGADPAKYDTFFEAFKSAGTKAIDDPALQSSNERSAA